MDFYPQNAALGKTVSEKRTVWALTWSDRVSAHLCTKLQVPSMGSTIQVGLGVSTHLAPAAAASSAMNLWWAGAQPEKMHQVLKTKHFKLLPVPSKTKQTQ